MLPQFTPTDFDKVVVFEFGFHGQEIGGFTTDLRKSQKKRKKPRRFEAMSSSWVSRGNAVHDNDSSADLEVGSKYEVEDPEVVVIHI